MPDVVLSIICPFFNEEGNLPELTTRLKALQGSLPIPSEIIFVNDGSTDRSSSVLKSLIGAAPAMQLVEHQTNLGKTAALITGFKQSKGRILATIDADLQNYPEDLPFLIRDLEKADLVAGVRVSRIDSLQSVLISRAANALRRALLKDGIHDAACGIAVFRREIAEFLFPFEGMHRFFKSLAVRAGARLIERPVRHDYRKWGRSKYPLSRRGLNVLWDLLSVIWIIKRMRRPL